jgi:hypothetical protein
MQRLSHKSETVWTLSGGGAVGHVSTFAAAAASHDDELVWQKSSIKAPSQVAKVECCPMHT